MRTLGFILLAVGLALALYAIGMNVAVPDPSGDYAGIANNDLLNQRLLFGGLGGAAFVSGWLVLILDRLGRRP